MARLSLSSIALLAKRMAPKLVLGCVFLACSTMIASCLVTSTPDFRAAPQTRPFLEADGAVPDIRQIVLVPPDTMKLGFSARLQSEDAKEKVRVYLYLDYGNQKDGFFSDAQPQQDVDPGSLSDAPRVVDAVWNRSLPSGCHTMTMIASHAFDNGVQCPTEIDDSTFLTWLLYVCATTPCTLQDIDASGCQLRSDANFCPQDGATTATSTGTQ